MNFLFPRNSARTTAFASKIRQEKRDPLAWREARSVFHASFSDDSQEWRSRFFAVIALITKRSRKRFRGSIKTDRSNILGVVGIGL